MKLKFLGKFYTPSTDSGLETSETEEAITFLGRKSLVKRVSATRTSPKGETMSFLGRRYTR
jgi:hypothetical protein